MTNVTLGQQMQLRLEALEITESELANRLEVPRTNVHNWVSDKHLPDFKMIKRIGVELNCSMDYLAGYTQDPERVRR